jgi:hypothetical protein
MSRIRTVAAFLVLPFAVSLITVAAGVAEAKPKKKKEAAPAGGDMTFEPEAVERNDAEPTPAEPARPQPTKKTKVVARPAAPSGPAGPASKTLERALKLYDA